MPSEALSILTTLNAPPRLIAHLEVVHDTALMLIHNLSETWPDLDFDKQGVLIGAATHDIGKVAYIDELTGQGTRHEEVGPQLPLDLSFPEKYARFARTHARWQQEPVIQLEDVLVAFADTIWKGKRDVELEQEIALQIARRTQEETELVFQMFGGDNPTWIGWREFRDAIIASYSVHAYRQDTDGQLREIEKRLSMAKLDYFTADEQEQLRRGADIRKDGNIYRYEEDGPLPLGPGWQFIVELGDLLAQRYGEDHVRLVVWFMS